MEKAPMMLRPGGVVTFRARMDKRRQLRPEKQERKGELPFLRQLFTSSSSFSDFSSSSFSFLHLFK